MRHSDRRFATYRQGFVGIGRGVIREDDKFVLFEIGKHVEFALSEVEGGPDFWDGDRGRGTDVG